MDELAKRNLILLGVGKLALCVAKQARSFQLNQKSICPAIWGTTRNKERMSFLSKQKIEPLLISELVKNFSVFEKLAKDADILVSLPPDHLLETLLANYCTQARKLVYVSSTSVYGPLSGVINDSTAISLDTDLSIKRLTSEAIWKSVGAIVLRSPAIYGPDRGLHLTLKEGTYQKPPNSQNFVSRIHQTDLANIILLSFEKLQRSETFVIGDKEPARHEDVVSWLCQKMNIEQKASSNLVPTSTRLRGDRQIDASRILQRLDYQLLYPNFRDGYSEIL
ncbi:MAG: hypothetical protein Q8T09_00120 [Candidatus Melainabacteria bacterium]|nr:hypothetical protein [Candidatus Melainabacteria bacterium]